MAEATWKPHQRSAPWLYMSGCPVSPTTHHSHFPSFLGTKLAFTIIYLSGMSVHLSLTDLQRTLNNALSTLPYFQRSAFRSSCLFPSRSPFMGSDSTYAQRRRWEICLLSSKELENFMWWLRFTEVKKQQTNKKIMLLKRESWFTLLHSISHFAKPLDVG